MSHVNFRLTLMRIQKSCMFVLVFDIVWLLCDFPGRSDEPGSRQSLLKVQAHSYTRNQRVRRHRERDVRFSGLLRLQHRGPPLLKLPQVRFSSFFFHSHYSLYSFVIWNKYSSFEMRFITLLVFSPVFLLRMEQNECECPCECPLEVNECTGNLTNAENR